MPPKRPPPKVVEDSDPEISDEELDEDEEEEFDLVEAMNEMPLDTRRRVYALKGYANEYNELMAKFREEVAALELELLAKRLPLFRARHEIVVGTRDVTEEEVSEGKKALAANAKVEEIPSSEDEAEEKKQPRKGVKVVDPKTTASADEKGVPNFWLTAFKHNEMLGNMISPRDEEVLAHLQDIELNYVDGKPTKGFTLLFHFEENPFFSNAVLTKTCMWDQDRKGDEEQIDKMIGCDINWISPSQNVTVMIKEKKQRHKGGKGVRIVKREEKVESFFHFFSPIQLTEDGEPIGTFEEDENPEEMISMDEDVTLAIMNNIIPRATMYYTGESLEKLAQAMQMHLGGMGDDEEDEGEEEEEEEEEEEAPPARGRGRGGRGAAAAAPPARGRGKAAHQDPQDCKQQ